MSVEPPSSDVAPSELARLDALVKAGRYVELEQSSRELLLRWPTSGALWRALGNSLWMQGKDALSALQRATALLPNDFVAHYNLATALLATGKLDEAIAASRRATELRPGFKAAHRDLGIALSRRGRRAEAIASFRRALQIDPDFIEALTGVADALQASGTHQEAILCYERALHLRPRMPEVHLRLGQAYQSLGRGGRAEASYRQAIAQNPALIEAYVSLARLLRLPYRTGEALSCIELALAVRPDDPEVIVAHAELLLGLGDYRQAVERFRFALQRNPAHEPARMGAVVAELAPVPMSVPEATESFAAYGRALAELESGLEQRPCADPPALIGSYRPFLLAYREQDGCELMRTYGRVCSNLMGEWQRGTGIAPHIRERSTARLRIGIVSEYVRDHSVYNALIHGWLQRLDRKRFAVEVFCLDARSDPQTEAAREMANHFEQGDRSLYEWTKAIADRRPDVLIYPEIGLNPFTVALASMRLAKTQVVSWGHPVTSGLPTLDFYLSANAFEPADGMRCYTERLVKLPNLGVYYEPPTAAARTQAPQTIAHDRGPVLVCPGTPFKYLPEHDAVLVDIARRLGRCQFHFFNFEDGALSERLLRRLNTAFSAAGLEASEFLVLRPWAKTPEFHDILRAADVMLDTIGFSGFNTVMQALQCGLPVVTARGRFLRGRLGSGILERLSLGELVAESPASFADIAVALCETPAARALMRERIREQLPRAYRDQSAIDELQEFLLQIG